MSAGITRIHGSVLTGAATNVTGSAGSFISGYQLRFFDFAGDFRDASINGALETLIRKVQTVATVMMVGVPTAGHVILALDGATYNGRDDNTGYQIGGAGETATEFLGTLSGVTVTEVVISGNTFA
jgi:hypothetical protein